MAARLVILGVIGLILLSGMAEANAQTRLMYLRGQSIHPSYEGWWPNDDGSYELWFGYMNSNWEEQLDVPVGQKNYFSVTAPGGLDDLGLQAFDAGQADKGQPTHFYPRRNPFLFTIRVPADFGEQELVWTLETHGIVNRAYASLKPDYRIDPQVMSTEVGGAFGSLDDRLRENVPPELTVEDGHHRDVKVGEGVSLVAIAKDPDDYPARSRRREPRNLEELYSTSGVGSVVASGAPGLRFSWTVYRGDADAVSFDPQQLKAWMDTRVWGNSPWSPPYVLPEVPADNRWVSEVTFSEPGDYVLRGVASDGSHFSYHNIHFVVSP